MEIHEVMKIGLFLITQANVVQTYTYKHAIKVCIHVESIVSKFDHEEWSEAEFLLHTVFLNKNDKFYAIAV